MVDLERTEWYPYNKKCKPVTAGVYEVQTDSWPYPSRIYWTGEEWQFYVFEDDCGNGFKYPNKVKDIINAKIDDTMNNRHVNNFIEKNNTKKDVL